MEASGDDLGFMSESFDGLDHLLFQLGQGLTTEVAKFHVLQIVPDPFVWVELRRIGGKGFQPDVVIGIGAEEAANGFSPMDPSLIPEAK